MLNVDKVGDNVVEGFQKETNKPNDDDFVDEVDSLKLMLFFGSHVCNDEYEGKDDLTAEGNELDDNGTFLCGLE